MRSRLPLAILLAMLASLSAAFAADGPSFSRVNPGTFDPGNTFLVQSTWLSGIGCPTNDPAFPCPAGDAKDNHNQGLLLAKTGSTSTNAAATAELKNVKGIKLTELGYDIRKPASIANSAGSHCGAGAPRFNIETSDGVIHFLGCGASAPTVAILNAGWLRLRWTAQLSSPASTFPPVLPTDTVKSIQIIFDEGQDTLPDNFGLAVLDNIDVNGTVVGRGPRHEDKDNNDSDRDGKDKKHKND
jgi:hypothetical protein